MIDVVDRVPTYIGRIKLVPVSGSDNLYDMSRADEPTVEGTPINKELFDSIKNDLLRISPNIITDTNLIAASRNVSYYPNLSATGLLENSDTTPNFLENTFPINSVLAVGVNGEAITLTDLPEQNGSLWLIKGASASLTFGYFASVSGKAFHYSKGNGWEELADKSYYDELVGDIGSVLDNISTGESEETISSIGIVIDEINGEVI